MKVKTGELSSGPSPKRVRTSALFDSDVDLPDDELVLCSSYTANMMQNPPSAVEPGACGDSVAPQSASAEVETSHRAEEPATADAAVASDRAGPLEDDVFLFHQGSHPGDFFASGDEFHSVYTVGHQIGSGGFGKVFIATHKKSGLRRAVKQMSKADARAEARENEIDALLALDHPHIVRMVEYFDEALYLYLVFELCEGPDLFDRIVTDPKARMAENDARVAVRHIFKALQCCHSQYRGHYDIKPENFMYVTADLKELMMIDLGLSSGFNAHRNSPQGTAAYAAPECRLGIYGPEADIWSCGVVLFVMLTGQPFLPPLPGKKMQRETEMRPLIRSRLRTAATTFSLSTDAQNLLCALLQHDRHERPTLREAMTHPFVEQAYLSENIHSRWTEPLVAEALELRQSLMDCFRAVAKEPMLRRVARLAIAYAYGATVAQRFAFRQMDRTGFGELSLTALEDDLKRLDQAVPRDLDSLFQTMDLHRHGYIRYLTFISVTLPAGLMKDETVCQVAFDMLDRNKDGFIDCGDLESVFHHESGNSLACRRCLKEVCGSSASTAQFSRSAFLQLMG